MSAWAAVLAGGSGTRFWPLSTDAVPKQLLPLAGDRPLVVEAVGRLHGLVPSDRILLVCGSAVAERIRRLLPDVPEENYLVEPKAAGTGPALAWATHTAAVRDPDAVVLSMHADWFVGDDAAFRASAARAMEVAARHDTLVTVGVVPTRPEVGYGYIEPGESLDGDARRVARFTEKPDLDRAEELIAGGALWNSGLFAWTATRFRAETEAVAPEIASALAALDDGAPDRFFAEVTPIVIDRSHFERSSRVAVIPGRFPWDDVGTWAALRRVRAVDRHGNVVVGSTYLRDSTDCVVWSDHSPVVVDGVSGLVVVHVRGVTLVTTAERAANLKALLEELPPEVRLPRTDDPL